MKPDDVCLWEQFALLKDCPLVRLIRRFDRYEGGGFVYWTAENLETGVFIPEIDEVHLIPINGMEVLAWVTKRVDEAKESQ